MIQANELRVGNKVFWDGKHPEYSVAAIVLVASNGVSIDTYEYGITGASISDIEPIPLTEEWLLRLGFETCKNGISLTVMNDFVFISSLFNGNILTLDIGGNRSQLSHIKHVHQLQNLYFALTGEELEIKH